VFTQSGDPSLPVAESEDDLYPCLLAMCGSGNGFFQISADGSFKLLDGSNRGGKSFHGFGSLLTGCENFEELLELAANGNQRSVDMFSDDLFQTDGKTEGDDSLYAKGGRTAPIIMYAFGKAIGTKLNDFKREDVAAALLNFFIMDTAQTMTLIALSAGIKRIVLCGSFVNSALVRKRLTSETVKRNLFAAAFGQPGVKFDFIKPGAHLGAIGALVSNYDKFGPKTGSS